MATMAISSIREFFLSLKDLRPAVVEFLDDLFKVYFRDSLLAGLVISPFQYNDLSTASKPVDSRYSPDTC